MLGGLGIQASILAYRLLNQFYSQRKGQGHTCPLRLLNVDFEPINQLLPYQQKASAKLLLPYLQDINQQDVCCIIMPNNTLHQSLDIILEKHSFEKPILHIGHLLHAEIKKLKRAQVMILGTAYTMQSGYLQSFLPEISNNILPNNSLLSKVEDLRKLYFHSSDTELSLQIWEDLNHQYPEVDYFIVACTELSIAFNSINEKKLDTLDLLCRSAVDYLFV